jgi:glycosyltransferase involved in cell wall biosynthesis
MRILVALHQVMDLGGIINHTEQLIGGLKDLGHTVHLKQFVYAIKAHEQNKTGDWIVGPSGIPHDQGKGWNFRRNDRIAYKGSAALATAKQIMVDYDLIIWTVPVPSKNKDNLGNHEWTNLYDLPRSIKQIAFVHDGNVKSGAPHILAIQDQLSGIACVHDCALNGANFLTTPRALVVNPQFNPVRKVASWAERKRGFVNMQTFKAWKHAHELIEAIAYMPPKRDDEYRHVAGLGIEYQYMTSEDKCKPEYYHPIDSRGQGGRFWEVALENGMVHEGYWNTPKVEEMLGSARALVDPSWSRKYAAVGGHWNRVVVDAMIHGAIPIARPMGMGDSIFEAGVHYWDIPDGHIDPEQYANLVLEVGEMSHQLAANYREAALQLLPMFDREIVAQRVIDLAFGSIDTIRGTDDPSIREKYSDLMFNHFGVLA